MSGTSYKKLLTILIGAKTNVSFIFLLISLLLGMEKKYLEGIGVKVRGEDTHFVVEYNDEVNSGECIYEVVNLKGKNKPINQIVYVMVSSEMGDIISGINDRHPLSENDMVELTMEIRNDSLNELNLYVREINKPIGSPS